MGCTVTKSNLHSKRSSILASPRDGDYLARFARAQNGEMDPRLPLTERQLYSVAKSWKAISRNMSTTAVNMFVRLFETNAELKTMFSDFGRLHYSSDLRESRQLQDHAMMVMCTIDEAITNLDDLDYVITSLHKVGRSHCRFEGYTPDTFWKIEEPFLLAVKETLGDRYTVSLEFSYKRTISFVLRNLSEGFSQTPGQHGAEGAAT